MATPFHLPVTAAQVGTYFVGHYYQVLQTQPDFVHQFYSDRSTLLRVDGHNRETATSMLQIHSLVTSLKYTGIEIRTVHALESWDRGVLVLVSGSVHVKDFNGKRNFVQTFFLAPQEEGYFVLNDIFHFIDDQPLHHHPVPYLTPNDVVPKLNASTALREQASSYISGGDIQARDLVPPNTVVENGTANNYSFQEQQLQAPGDESILENSYVVQQTNGSVQNSGKSLEDHFPVEEPVGEPQKHTYASILQVAIGHSAPSAPREQPATKSTTPSELNHRPEPSGQQSIEAPTEGMEGTSVADEEAEVKSIYVKNVPSTANVSDIEEQFKKFGKIRQDGVAIRTRKDLDVCYAFVEFEDITSVHIAIKVYIEGRRANRSNAYGGGRGRGRFGGRNYSNGSSRGNGHDGIDYTRPRGNGYYRREDWTYSSPHQVVGWPPVKTYRMNNLLNQAKFSKNEGESGVGGNDTSKKKKNIDHENKNDEAVAKETGRSGFVKVNMDGLPIGRKVDLNAHDCYETLALALEVMFLKAYTSLTSISREKQQRSRLLDGSSEFVLTYEDREGDWMLVGDVPWRMFLGTVKRLRIMKTSDANGLAPRYQEKNQKPKKKLLGLKR